MATVPIRIAVEHLSSQLATLEVELQEGHVVELVRGDTVIGEVHRPSEAGALPQRPDFRAQLKRLWGDRILDVDTTAWVREDRDG